MYQRAEQSLEVPEVLALVVPVQEVLADQILVLEVLILVLVDQILVALVLLADQQIPDKIEFKIT